jgi:biotin carboxyl carrier protein
VTTPAREFDEALAFVQLFALGSWTSCHVRTGKLEIFVSRDARHENPMVARRIAPAEIAGEPLTAPHIGTLIELAPIGSRVEEGACYGALSVLDDRVDLITDHAGTVADHLQPLGALVEFDQPLVRMR